MRSASQEEIARLEKMLLESAACVDESRKRMRESHERLVESTKELLEDPPLPRRK